MSRISFCNFALAKELFKRNWYVSALYLLGWLLTLVPTISRMRYTVYTYSLDPTNSLSSYLPLFLTFSAFFTLAYCVVATCVNCDYLFKPESARFYGAGAVRRSTLLLTSFVVTVLPGLAVNVITGLLFTFAEASACFELCLGPTLIASGCLLVIIHGGLCVRRFRARAWCSSLSRLCCTAMLALLISASKPPLPCSHTASPATWNRQISPCSSRPWRKWKHSS